MRAGSHALVQGAFRLFAAKSDASQWFPLDVPFPRDLARMVRTSACVQNPITGNLSWKGRHFLVQSFPGKHLTGIQLFAFFPTTLIEEPFANLRTWIVRGVLFLMVGCALLSFLFAEAFVAPLLGITLIEAVQKRSSTGSSLLLIEHTNQA